VLDKNLGFASLSIIRNCEVNSDKKCGDLVKQRQEVYCFDNFSPRPLQGVLYSYYKLVNPSSQVLIWSIISLDDLRERGIKPRKH
jgi:hypothetical protein